MIDKLKKHLSAIDKIVERLKINLQPVQTNFAKFIGKKKQYVNSFCLGKRQVSNKELLFLLEQYDIFKTVNDKKSRWKFHLTLSVSDVRRLGHVFETTCTVHIAWHISSWRVICVILLKTKESDKKN